MHDLDRLAERRVRRTARLPQMIALVTALSGPWLPALARTVTLESLAPQATLRDTFEWVWAQQPEAKAAAHRRQALQAQAQAVGAWTPEPAALELSAKTDRANSNEGAREVEAGISVPLWLPREQGQSQAVVDAEARALESHLAAARLRAAATLRDAWWNWLRSSSDLASAREQRESAQRLFRDVAQRVESGDLARADRHQAEGALAAAQAAVANAEGQAAVELQRLTALLPLGLKLADASSAPEPEPDLGGEASLDSHPDLLAAADRTRAAETLTALARTQSRGNPELKLALTRDRGSFAEPYRQTLTLGIRVPWGGSAQHAARVATAQADAVAAQAQGALDRARLRSETEAAQAKLRAAKSQVAAAEQRALLAQETRRFYDKAFRLGEADLPTRLRVEAEAAEAARQALRAHIELGAAISALRQALGLLPQ